jgi:hypothetical protein
VLLGDDVLDVERDEIVVLFVKAAVITTMACPLPDKGPESGVHYPPGELASSWRAFDLRMAMNVL